MDPQFDSEAPGDSGDGAPAPSNPISPGDQTADQARRPDEVLQSAAQGLADLQEPDADEVPQVVDVPERPRRDPPSSAADYSRTVLSISTPVAVVLARKKVSLDRIVNLVPGSMLTFDAHCDEPLMLEAGGHPIAKGETVKIGDKFGLRIRQILEGSEDDDRNPR
jgi:flagellar motor switch protein FliN/FliY